MKITTQSYHEAKVKALYEKLRRKEENGKPHRFEVHVDGLKVVQQSEDLERFFEYLDLVDGNTREIIIVLRYGRTSNDYEKHIFLLSSGRDHQPENALNGVDQKAEVNKMVNDILRDKSLEELKEKYLTLQENYQKATDELAALSKEYEAYRDKKIDLTNLAAGEVAAHAVSQLAKNPALLGSLPGARHLAGLLNLGNGESGEEPVADLSGNDDDFAPAAQAVPAESQAMTGVQDNPDLSPYLNVVLGARNDLENDEFNHLFAIFQFLRKHKPLIYETFDLLDIQK